MADAAAVLGVLGTLPEGANPYEAVRKYALEALNPPLPPSHRRQLIAIAVIFSISLLFILGSLVARLLNHSFWVLHFADNPRLVRPHFSVSWSLWAVVFLVLIEVVVIDSIQQFQRAAIQHDYAAWRLFAWLPACYGGWTAAWGVTVSYLPHLHAYGRAGPVDRLAPWVNAAAVVVPVTFSLIFLPLSATAAHRFDWTMDTFDEIDALLQGLAAAYHGESPVMELLSSGLPLLQELDKRTSIFFRWWKIALSIAAAFGLFLVALLVAIATLYLIALRRVLRVSSWQTESGSTRASSLKPLRRTYANMAITIFAFTILGLTTSSTVIVMAAIHKGFTDPVKSQIFTLLPFYAFAILGLPSSILLFVRAFDPTRDRSRSHTRVSVNVNVVSFSEGPLPPSPATKRQSHAVPYLDARRALALPVPDGFELMPQSSKSHRTSAPTSLSQLCPSLEVRASHSSLDKDLRPFEEYAHFPPEPERALGAARPDSVYSVGRSSFEGSPVAGRDPFVFGSTARLAPEATPPPPSPSAELNAAGAGGAVDRDRHWWKEY